MPNAQLLEILREAAHPLWDGDKAYDPVIDAIGISARRFEQLFAEQVGLTPKLFCRIQRFQRVLHLINEQADIDWSDIALSCGYFDQSHFIHDFQSFSPEASLTERFPEVRNSRALRTIQELAG